MASLANLLTSRDRVFYELFVSFAATTVHAAQLLDEMLQDYPERSGELFAQIVECEREGDTTLHEIRARLNQTFVTPIDREDILELGSAFDDVIDFTEETADYLGLYAIEAPMEQAQRLSRILLDATRQLQLAVPSVRDFSDASRRSTRCTGWRTRAIASAVTRSRRCSRAGSTRWSSSAGRTSSPASSTRSTPASASPS